MFHDIFSTVLLFADNRQSFGVHAFRKYGAEVLVGWSGVAFRRRTSGANEVPDAAAQPHEGAPLVGNPGCMVTRCGYRGERSFLVIFWRPLGAGSHEFHLVRHLTFV
jgi:hypothetical protein